MSYAYFVKYNLDKNVEILTKPNKHELDKADVIIPIGIESQEELIEIGKYSHKLLLCNGPKIYNVLDDKIKFYNYIVKNDLLANTDVELIKTYGRGYNGENIHGKFYIKDKDSAGSYDNKIRKGYIYDLIKKYRRHQIQEVIDVKKIHGINCLCVNGKIISSLNFITPKSISSNFYYKDNKQMLEPMVEPFITVCSNIVKQTNYTGLIEIEFILSASGNIYLLECNPRLSGNVKCVMKHGSHGESHNGGHNDHFDSPYMKNLIKPYVNIINDKRIKLEEYERKYKLIFKGSFNAPDYSSCNCGVVKF